MRKRYLAITILAMCGMLAGCNGSSDTVQGTSTTVQEQTTLTSTDESKESESLVETSVETGNPTESQVPETTEAESSEDSPYVPADQMKVGNKWGILGNHAKLPKEYSGYHFLRGYVYPEGASEYGFIINTEGEGFSFVTDNFTDDKLYHQELNMVLKDTESGKAILFDCMGEDYEAFAADPSRKEVIINGKYRSCILKNEGTSDYRVFVLITKNILLDGEKKGYDALSIDFTNTTLSEDEMCGIVGNILDAMVFVPVNTNYEIIE